MYRPMSMRSYKSSRLGPNAFFRDRERMSSHQSLAGEKQPLLKLLGTGQLGSALSPNTFEYYQEALAILFDSGGNIVL